MKINTPAAVAIKLDTSLRRVQQLIKEHNITLVACPCCGASDRGITDADVKRLANRKTTPGKAKAVKK